ncbi:MAG TPA: hypothetical protein VF854_02630 [Azonexus sp.]
MLASLSFGAMAAQPPTIQDVRVTNPVLPVEVSNADPVSVIVQDEPARVPYSYTIAPTCQYTNQCLGTFPAVPAGKRLRITSIAGFFVGTNVSGFAALYVDSQSDFRFAFPVAPFNAAYYGAMLSFNQPVDFFVEASHAPVLELGIPAGSGGIYVDTRNKFTVSGYLVDASP